MLNRMPEAEVSVRLAFWLIQNQMAAGDVDVAIDGAQVKVGDTVHFDLSGFLQSAGWRKRGTDNSKWQDIYQHADYSSKIRIHSSPGKGDVVVPITNRSYLASRVQERTDNPQQEFCRIPVDP